jgi:hypothetical protein
MIELSQATADEMVLAFLKADMDTPAKDRRDSYADALAGTGAAKATLVGDNADPKNQWQSDARMFILRAVGGYGLGKYLFVNFPDNTAWQLVTVPPAEVNGFCATLPRVFHRGLFREAAGALHTR